MWVALPAGYSKSHAPYPVLYAGDANAEFSTVIGAARLLAFDGTIPELIVVGIGYPLPGQGFRASFAERSMDFTPPAGPEAMRGITDTAVALHVPAPRAIGGAADFLDFLKHDLMPSIEKKYDASPTDRAWFGHSLAGLFGLHALFHGDALFQRYLIGSPSLWWDHEVLFKTEASYAQQHMSLPIRLFLSVGGDEEAALPGMNMGSNLNRFSAQIADHHYRDLTVETRVFDGDGHGSVIPVTVSRGLRSIYAK